MEISPDDEPHTWPIGCIIVKTNGWPDARLSRDSAEILEDVARPELHLLTIEADGRVVGAIQWQAEDDPMYRHAGIDLYIDPSLHRRGLGSDAVRALARHLIDDCGHHRLVIDPAADNRAAIRCYAKVGFRAVGLMCRYERVADGSWHDGLRMDMLAEDLIDDRTQDEGRITP